jgi:flagellar FliL protein
MAKKDAKKTEAPADGAEGADGEAPAKKGLPKKMIIIGAAAAVLVLGGGGAGAFFLLGGKGGEEHGAAGEKHAEKKPKKEKKGGGGHGGKAGEEGGYGKVSEGPEGVVFYTLPDLVANIQSSSGKTAYLKLKLTLELPDHETADAFEPNAPRLSDMFTTFLREVREEDLAGSEGSYQLRMELQRRVNLVIAPAKVNAVLIEEMLIQ